MAATDNTNQNLVVTAFWEVNSGEESTVAELLKAFLPQAQREPGVKEFQIHQNVAKPREFFFYEVFAGEAAFADHQQTDHFKNIIVGQAIAAAARHFSSCCSRLLPASRAAISNAARPSARRPSLQSRSPRTLSRR